MVDSGASTHMLSKKGFKFRRNGYFCGDPGPSTTVVTANGEKQTHEKAPVYVHDLNLLVTVQILDDAFASSITSWEIPGLIGISKLESQLQV